ncbi:hypothetical protein P4S72_20720 [Vibrio sp. PP-XX7]
MTRPAIIGGRFLEGADDQDQDAQVKSWLEIADTSVQPEKRIEHYKKAIARITQQAYWAPMFSYTSNYASHFRHNFRAVSR